MTDWLHAYAGDAFVTKRLSDADQLADMLRVEAAFSRALGRVGLVDTQLAATAADAILAVELDEADLQASAMKDGLPVPGLVAQIKAQLDATLHAAIHKKLTSQDVMDTALVLALRDILAEFEGRIVELQAQFQQLQERFGSNFLVGRTRMQAALEVGAAHRIRQWAMPWPSHLERLNALRANLLCLQLGGPVGTRDSFQGHGDAIAQAMAETLDISEPSRAWHSDRSAIAELGAWLASVAGSLGKMGADISLMAQQGVDEISLATGGSSSAMPHKSNPVLAELLVTLARDCASQLPALHGAMVHEQERSGAAWTLEWLVLPRLLSGCGAGLRAGQTLVSDIQMLGSSERN